MKRNYVFVWGEDVQPTIETLSSTKIAALRAHCRALIARAEYYRQNPMLLLTIVEMPHLTDEDLPWAPFVKFGHRFKLVCREAKKREYVLNLASPPEPETPGPDSSGAAPGRRRRRARGVARPASVRRPPMASDKRSMSYKTAWNSTKQGIDALYGSLSPILRISVRLMKDARGNVVSQTRKLGGSLSALATRAASMRRRICASFRTSHECAAHGPEARLEPRLLGQNTGVQLLLYTFVWNNETIDWNADLFGAPVHGK